jgi:hypothetical protein
MCFCNPEPIAAACFLAKDVVKSALDAFTTAIIHLTTLNHSLKVTLGFVSLTISRKTLTYAYSNSTIANCNNVNYQYKMR